ncbi:hypothetical protein HK405_008695 [Cladochytrium tenue]|nr:hypothetical protein HK405_008695 [Cladochytrium tenue]
MERSVATKLAADKSVNNVYDVGIIIGSKVESRRKPSDTRAEPQHSPLRVLFASHHDPARATPPSAFDATEVELREATFLRLGRKVTQAAGTATAAAAAGDSSCLSTPVGAGSTQQPRDSSPEALTASAGDLPPLSGISTEHLWFRSKVVSRRHADIWLKCGQLYLKDAGSSSGTFLNGMRLSPAGKLSRPYHLRNGDVIQLGADYQGRQEDLFKGVVMKISLVLNPCVQRRQKENPSRFQAALRLLVDAANPFSSSPVDTVPSVSAATPTRSSSTKGRAADTPATKVASPQPAAASSASVDCCICLGAIGPCQALFMSPCSHCYHYKCIRNLLWQSPMFLCPLCRQVANLDASVSTESLFFPADGEGSDAAGVLDNDGGAVSDSNEAADTTAIIGDGRWGDPDDDVVPAAARGRDRVSGASVELKGGFAGIDEDGTDTSLSSLARGRARV